MAEEYETLPFKHLRWALVTSLCSESAIHNGSFENCSKLTVKYQRLAMKIDKVKLEGRAMNERTSHYSILVLTFRVVTLEIA